MKPKLLLVYPPITQRERYGGLSGIFGGKQIPLGLFYLAAYARAHGYAVDVVDAEARRLRAESVVAILREGGFNVLGISANTVSFHRALELAGLVKQAAPETVTVIGRMLTFPGVGVQVWRLGGEFVHYACAPMV
jgi:hypothetical protein